MVSIPSSLLAGFLAEAAQYVATLKTLLRDYEDKKAEEIEEIFTLLNSSAQMIGLAEIETLSSTGLFLIGDASSSTSVAELEAIASTMSQVIATASGTLPEADAPVEEAPQPQSNVVVTTSIRDYLPDLPEELVQIFTQEASEHEQAIYKGIVQLETQRQNLELIKEIRRVAHTLKGAAASVGYKELARMAHHLEDGLEITIEHQQPIDDGVYALLSDTSFAISKLVQPEETFDYTSLQTSIDSRYQNLLGEEFKPSTPAETAADVEGSASITLRSETLLQVPMARIDAIIDQVGEIIISQSTVDFQLSRLRQLTREMQQATKRLQRIIRDVDDHVEGQGLHLTHQEQDPDFDELELEQYTILHQLTRELDEVSLDSSGLQRQFLSMSLDMQVSLEREQQLTIELQRELLGTRLRSFQDIEIRLRRTAQQTATDLGKDIQLVLRGLDTQVDKTTLDQLLEPLTHLLRNAVDHGIEEPNIRRENAKSQTGIIEVSFERVRDTIRITIRDDGNGIETDKVLKRAMDLGFIRAEDDLSPQAIQELVFIDGFSVSEVVTTTSGRGVGLNIVRKSIERMQGKVRIASSSLQGTIFVLEIPATLALQQVLFVGTSSQSFAVPLGQILSIIRFSSDKVEAATKTATISHNNYKYQAFDLREYAGEGEDSQIEQRYGLAIDTEPRRTMVLVDKLERFQEAVVKPLGQHLKQVKGVTGATIASNGVVILLLNLPELLDIDETHTWSANGMHSSVTQSSINTYAKLNVLIVDDSPTVRRTVSTQLQADGWNTHMARDGIEAWEYLQENPVDIALVDIEMPRMNGFELLSKIRGTKSLTGLPVVFLTSRSASKHQQRAISLGVSEYLVKPFEKKQLIQTLKRLVETHRSQ